MQDVDIATSCIIAQPNGFVNKNVDFSTSALKNRQGKTLSRENVLLCHFVTYSKLFFYKLTAQDTAILCGNGNLDKAVVIREFLAVKYIGKM